MNHENFTRMASAYIDGELPLPQHEKFLSHVKNCSECSAVLRDYKQYKNAFDAMEVPEPSMVTDSVILQKARALNSPGKNRLLEIIIKIIFSKPAVAYATIALIAGITLGNIGFNAIKDKKEPSYSEFLNTEIFSEVYPGSIADAVNIITREK